MELVVHTGRVDLFRRRLERSDGIVTLTPREAGLLEYLARSAPRAVPVDELLVEVWSYRPGVDSRTVVSTVHTLRTKLERDPTRPEHVLTVRGEGYRFVEARKAPLAALEALVRHEGLDPGVRRHLLLAQVEQLALDHPEQALALLDELGLPDSPARIGLLASLGRLHEAEELLGRTRSGDPRLLLDAALLARRRGELARSASWLRQALKAELPEVQAEAWMRLAVLQLDSGSVEQGMESLARARALLLALKAPRQLAGVEIEEGLYRLMLGELEPAQKRLLQALQAAQRTETRYAEKIARTGLSLALRLAGDEREAERHRDIAHQLGVERWEEPGISLFRALERQLADDPQGAQQALQEGLLREQQRPNPADGAMLRALAARWQGEPLPEDTPPLFVRLLQRPLPPRWARALGPQRPSKDSIELSSSRSRSSQRVCPPSR
jgi:tetratricopeptide (TPR) repeat protein